MRRIEEMHKDKVDESILEFLRKDSRESFVEIGKKLKLSESAIRHRVKNMVGSGTITKFTVEEGGGQPEALVMVSADSSIDTSKVSLKLTKLNAVKKIYEITGQYDICVIIIIACMTIPTLVITFQLDCTNATDYINTNL